MGNKSDPSSQIISLPKGGGAMHGIGEKFAPDLHTGTGNFTVPIALPPGRNGFQPQLSLVYSSGNGNGPFGLGWSLKIPGIARQTSKGVPIYDHPKDTFILSGAEDLVPVRHEPGVTFYRPRTEGLFARIGYRHDTTNSFWEVRSKDGLIRRYGTPGAAGTDPAVIADPTKRNKVFAWRLTQTTDAFGNLIEYEYERDLSEDQFHHLTTTGISCIPGAFGTWTTQMAAPPSFLYRSPSSMKSVPMHSPNIVQASRFARAGAVVRSPCGRTPIKIAPSARTLKANRLLALTREARTLKQRASQAQSALKSLIKQGQSLTSQLAKGLVTVTPDDYRTSTLATIQKRQSQVSEAVSGLTKSRAATKELTKSANAVVSEIQAERAIAGKLLGALGKRAKDI